MILFYLIFCRGRWKKELVNWNLNLRVRLAERCFLTENVYCSPPAPRAWWKDPRQKNRFLFGIPFISNSLYFWLVVYENIQPFLNLSLISCLSSFFFSFFAKCHLRPWISSLLLIQSSKQTKTFNHLLKIIR